MSGICCPAGVALQDELGQGLRRYMSLVRVAPLPPTASPARISGITAGKGGCTAAGAAKATAGSKARLRILGLHGYVQNGAVFRQKIGSVRKVLRACDFEFVDAPHSAAGAFPDDAAADFDADPGAGAGAADAGDGVGPRGWWHAGENATRAPGDAWVRPAISRSCVGWDESLEAARRDITALGGTFDGVFGFSQGCAVTTALLREAAEGRFPPLAGVRFAVLAGGFLPLDATVAASLRGDGRPIALRTLHVTGLQDTFVPRTPCGEDLAALYDAAGASWLEHPGRHGVPTCTGGFKDALRAVIAASA